jgi:hypothetical protein
MAELMRPIDKQVMMCDDEADLMMLACAMLSTVKTIMDNQLGVEGRKKMLSEYNDMSPIKRDGLH